MNPWIRGVIMGLAALDACTLIRCSSAPPPPPAPLPLWDGGDGCEAACARRDALGCLETSLRPVCVDVCRRAAERGLYRPECVVSARTRDELELVCRVRCGS